MKRILYAGGAVLTGDAMAHSVAMYATALAKAGAADTVKIPVMTEGTRSTVEIVIGPASQLIIEDAGVEFDDEFDDAPYLEQLETSRRSFDFPDHVQPRAREEGDSSSLDEF